MEIKSVKWNKEKQAPVEGTFARLNIPGKELMEKFRLILTEKWEDRGLWTHLGRSDMADLLANEGLTLDEYLLNHLYRTEDTYNYQPCVLYLLLRAASEFMPEERRERFLYMLGMDALRKGMSVSDEMDFLCRLYYCESDEDVWDILLEGIGDPRYFAYGYGGDPFADCAFDPFFPQKIREERLRRYVVYMASNGVDMDRLIFD